MASTEDAQAAPDFNGQPKITLSTQELEILACLVYELGNIQEPRLVQIGSTSADARELSTTLRDAADRGLSASRIRIIGRDVSNGANPTQSAENFIAADNSVEMRVHLPPDVLQNLRRLCSLVITALGPREIRYRTGYYIEEVEALVTKLDP